MRRYRVLFALVVLVCASTLGYSYVSSPASAAVATYERQAELPADERTQVVPATGNVTVVAGHGMKGESAALVAFGPEGRVAYYNDTFHGYFDVDPVKGTETTVEYVAERNYEGDACKGSCTLSVVERLNLTTGEIERIYSRVIPADRGANWHDVDRLGENRLLVGAINTDEMYVVNTTTGMTTWEWSTKQAYPISGGGPYPADWAHLNDVERLPDGRYMTSLRNQDAVAFVDPQTGVQENWTLGSDGAHDVLYEQHNPDYIPESEGGPAVVVADSLNDRIVEYQREDGSWNRTWVWTDAEMKWPRDADRLPNGNTLVADTNAHRVLEVNETGAVVWSAEFYAPYELERLGTGDESAGGPSAAAADLDSRGTESADMDENTTSVAGYTPRKVTNSISFVLPVWMGLSDAAVAVLLALTVLAWAVLEYRHVSFSLSFRWPVRRE
ncbi:arylsulfotransferase family protein [Halorussus gelatinilyticus]|uniref:Arylsulfotransferase family protein n=1 Tax=Halorussus gelatinilyticus TaxID=2937524 RepID=A0A8U0II90_9EURY|nr:arylsulfotransferase family protein [Halorussus gelatinilyticus]UPW00518.1 arylsulfotransferase family protein [Halorussus gelatinilyticus]